VIVAATFNAHLLTYSQYAFSLMRLKIWI